MRSIRLLAALLAGAFVLTACGSGGGSGTEVVADLPALGTPEYVKAVADRTSQLETFSFSVDVEVPSESGDPAHLTVEGAADVTKPSLRLETQPADLLALAGPEMSGFASMLGDDPLELRLVDGVLYARLGTLGSLLGLAGEWVSLPVEGGADEAVGGLTVEGDPTEVLDALSEIADVRELGSEDVRGVGTTHVRADIDVQALADKMGPLGGAGGPDLPPTVPVELWIDDSGLPRRVSATFEETTLTLELYDVGEPVDVEAPEGATELDPSMLFGLMPS